MKIYKLSALSLVFFLIITLFPIFGKAASDDESDRNIYFRPGIRWGTDDRVLFILDFLVPIYQGEKSILFLNQKFTPNNQDGWETNVGIGYRHILLDDNLILGANLFYDHRKTKYGSHFDQLGIGLEAMADINGVGLTGRINYYHTLGDSFHRVSALGGYFFQGYGLYSGIGYEEALGGFDYEGGIRIPYISDYVETWAYAGGYHYDGRHGKDRNGFVTRLEVIPTDFIRLNFEYRHDNISHSDFYGEVAFEIPFSIGNLVCGKNPFEGIGDTFTGSRPLEERMVDPVRRDVDIQVETEKSSGDYGLGVTKIEDIVFASDEGLDTVEDGSFENPFNSLEQAQSYASSNSISTIHVMKGNGTGLNGYYFSDDNLLLWGAGVNHPSYPNIINMVRGFPIIESTIFLEGNNITACGLEFNSSVSGITVLGGSSNIRNNIFNISGSSPGIFIDGTSGNIFVSITDNEMNITNNSGDATGISAVMNGATTSPDNPWIIANNIINVTASNTAYGLYLRALNGGSLYFSYADNYINLSDTDPTNRTSYHWYWNIENNGIIGDDDDPSHCITYSSPEFTTTYNGVSNFSSYALYEYVTPPDSFLRTNISISLPDFTNTELININGGDFDVHSHLLTNGNLYMFQYLYFRTTTQIISITNIIDIYGSVDSEITINGGTSLIEFNKEDILRFSP